MLLTYLYGYAQIILSAAVFGSTLAPSMVSKTIVALALGALGLAYSNIGISPYLMMPYWSLTTLDVTVALHTDRWMGLTLWMLTVISITVLTYATWYANSNPTSSVLVINLAMFSLGMGLLILSHDVLSLVLAWELIGTLSYLLIGHFGDRPEASKASLKAVTYNRIGDAGVLTAIVVGIWNTGDSRLSTWSTCLDLLPHTLGMPSVTIISMGFLLGLYAKSAQFGMQTWLLDAMEGPTPVSALLHSCTLVTAGVIVMIKTEAVWHATPGTCISLIFLGTTSTLLASLLSVLQLDAKRTVALSTCVHIGIMVMALGAGQAAWASEHLFIHGWCKATLFMLVGVGIHTLHSQDVRLTGSLNSSMPLTSSICLVMILAISGMPGSHISQIKDMLITVGLTSTDSRVLVLGLICSVWLSQGYSISTWAYTWHESGRTASTYMGLGLHCTLLVLYVIGTLTPYAMGDSTSADRLGYPELGNSTTWTCLDPVGLALYAGLLIGAIRGRTPSTTASWTPTLITYWNRGGLDKLMGILSTWLMGNVWQRTMQDVDGNTTGGLAWMTRISATGSLRTVSMHKAQSGLPVLLTTALILTQL